MSQSNTVTSGSKPTSSMKKEMSKCYTCYVSGTEKPLFKCSRCKAAKYCSRECQKANWKAHKVNCTNNAALAEALKKHENTPLGFLDRFMLPDGISMFELDQRLEKWVKFHSPTMMAAVLHALRIPEDLNRARQYVLYIKLLPRSRGEHGGVPAKFFKVDDAYPVSVEEAMGWPSPWMESLVSLRNMQDESERKGRGRGTAAMVECPPLAVQTVPFGSLMDNMKELGIMEDWKSIMTKDIEKGKRFTFFGDGHGRVY